MNWLKTNIDVGVSKNSGTPKWMVYKFIKENPIKMELKWMIWRYHYFWKHPCEHFVLPKFQEAVSMLFSFKVSLTFQVLKSQS